MVETGATRDDSVETGVQVVQVVSQEEGVTVIRMEVMEVQGTAST
jgi:hypothetical protein